MLVLQLVVVAIRSGSFHCVVCHRVRRAVFDLLAVLVLIQSREFIRPVRLGRCRFLARDVYPRLFSVDFYLLLQLNRHTRRALAILVVRVVPRLRAADARQFRIDDGRGIPVSSGMLVVRSGNLRQRAARRAVAGHRQFLYDVGNRFPLVVLAQAGKSVGPAVGRGDCLRGDHDAGVSGGIDHLIGDRSRARGRIVVVLPGLVYGDIHRLRLVLDVNRLSQAVDVDIAVARRRALRLADGEHQLQRAIQQISRRRRNLHQLIHLVAVQLAQATHAAIRTRLGVRLAIALGNNPNKAAVLILVQLEFGIGKGNIVIALFYLIEPYAVGRGRCRRIVREGDIHVLRGSTLVLLAVELHLVDELQIRARIHVVRLAVDAVRILQNQLLAVRNDQVQIAIGPVTVVSLGCRVAPLAAGDLLAVLVIQLHGVGLQRHGVGMIAQRSSLVVPLQRILNGQLSARLAQILQAVAVQLHRVVRRVDDPLILRNLSDLGHRSLQIRLADPVFLRVRSRFTVDPDRGRILDGDLIHVPLEERIRSLGRNRDDDRRVRRVFLPPDIHRQRLGGAVRIHGYADSVAVVRDVPVIVSRQPAGKHPFVADAHRHAGHRHVRRKRIDNLDALSGYAIRNLKGNIPAQVGRIRLVVFVQLARKRLVDGQLVARQHLIRGAPAPLANLQLCGVFHQARIGFRIRIRIVGQAHNLIRICRQAVGHVDDKALVSRLAIHHGFARARDGIILSLYAQIRELQRLQIIGVQVVIASKRVGDLRFYRQLIFRHRNRDRPLNPIAIAVRLSAATVLRNVAQARPDFLLGLILANLGVVYDLGHVVDHRVVGDGVLGRDRRAFLDDIGIDPVHHFRHRRKVSSGQHGCRIGRARLFFLDRHLRTGSQRVIRHGVRQRVALLPGDAQLVRVQRDRPFDGAILVVRPSILLDVVDADANAFLPVAADLHFSLFQVRVIPGNIRNGLIDMERIHDLVAVAVVATLRVRFDLLVQRSNHAINRCVICNRAAGSVGGALRDLSRTRNECHACGQRFLPVVNDMHARDVHVVRVDVDGVREVASRGIPALVLFDHVKDIAKADLRLSALGIQMDLVLIIERLVVPVGGERRIRIIDQPVGFLVGAIRRIDAIERDGSVAVSGIIRGRRRITRAAVPVKRIVHRHILKAVARAVQHIPELSV